ncbi:MAG: histidinol-phosphatase [Alphaproteobacteria bacterium]|nr:histidinol-phosphatase [Alphaproteobacteria bacterium]
MSQIRPSDFHSYSQFLTCAHALADVAALETIRHFRSSTAIEDKSAAHDYTGNQDGFDPVTAADRGAEQAIRRELASRFPEHGIHGEEFGLHNLQSRYRWIVDPIDGTAAFLMGWPMWGTLIALADGDTPILGLLDQPFTRERFWSDEAAAVARGPDGTEHRLMTRPCARLEDAVLSTTHPDFFRDAGDLEGFQRVKAAARNTRYGGDCYAYAMLAAGFSDLVIETGLKSYDVAALIPIVERAGGVMTTWRGEPALEGGNIIAAGDPRAHAAALALLVR